MPDPHADLRRKIYTLYSHALLCTLHLLSVHSLGTCRASRSAFGPCYDGLGAAAQHFITLREVKQPPVEARCCKTFAAS